jgi:hypothetical protein
MFSNCKFCEIFWSRHGRCYWMSLTSGLRCPAILGVWASLMSWKTCFPSILTAFYRLMNLPFGIKRRDKCFERPGQVRRNFAGYSISAHLFNNLYVPSLNIGPHPLLVDLLENVTEWFSLPTKHETQSKRRRCRTGSWCGRGTISVFPTLRESDGCNSMAIEMNPRPWASLCIGDFQIYHYDNLAGCWFSMVNFLVSFLSLLLNHVRHYLHVSHIHGRRKAKVSIANVFVQTSTTMHRGRIIFAENSSQKGGTTGRNPLFGEYGAVIFWPETIANHDCWRDSGRIQRTDSRMFPSAYCAIVSMPLFGDDACLHST